MPPTKTNIFYSFKPKTTLSDASDPIIKHIEEKGKSANKAIIYCRRHVYTGQHMYKSTIAMAYFNCIRYMEHVNGNCEIGPSEVPLHGLRARNPCNVYFEYILVFKIIHLQIQTEVRMQSKMPWLWCIQSCINYL